MCGCNEGIKLVFYDGEIMGTKLGAAGGFSGAREKCGMGIFSSGGIGYGLFKFEDAVLVFGDCGKVGKKNGAMECPNGGTYNGTYDAVILEKGERSRAVRS